MTSHEYGFDEQLSMSSCVAVEGMLEKILVERFPGFLSITKAARDNDRIGVDYWVEMRNARHIAIDVKVRGEDWAATHPNEDDLALETWSVCENNIIGWTRDESKRCDYVIWIWLDTGRHCIIPFPMLCHVFNMKWQEWADTYKTRQQETTRGNNTSYHSECIFVPRRAIWAEIYRVYSGKLDEPARLHH